MSKRSCKNCVHCKLATDFNDLVKDVMLSRDVDWICDIIGFAHNFSSLTHFADRCPRYSETDINYNNHISRENALSHMLKTTPVSKESPTTSDVMIGCSCIIFCIASFVGMIGLIVWFWLKFVFM